MAGQPSFQWPDLALSSFLCVSGCETERHAQADALVSSLPRAVKPVLRAHTLSVCGAHPRGALLKPWSTQVVRSCVFR